MPFSRFIGMVATGILPPAAGRELELLERIPAVTAEQTANWFRRFHACSPASIVRKDCAWGFLTAAPHFPV